MGAGAPCLGDDQGGRDPELRTVPNHYRMFHIPVKNKPNYWNLIRRPCSNGSTDFQRAMSLKGAEDTPGSRRLRKCSCLVGTAARARKRHIIYAGAWSLRSTLKRADLRLYMDRRSPLVPNFETFGQILIGVADPRRARDVFLLGGDSRRSKQENIKELGF